MNNECLRVADQLRRAFEGKAWHGSSLKELLADVTAQQAAARPIPAAHSIWELVSHIEVWTRAAAEAVGGVPMPKIVGTDKDWPPVKDSGAKAWAEALDHLFEASRQLSQAMEGFADERLQEPVPGREYKYNFYFLFHGIVQHSLYHAGQIALLKKAVQSS